MGAGSPTDAFVTLAGALPTRWLGGLVAARVCLPADPDCDLCKLAGEGLRVSCDTCRDGHRRGAGEAEDAAGRTVCSTERGAIKIKEEWR